MSADDHVRLAAARQWSWEVHCAVPRSFSQPLAVRS